MQKIITPEMLTAPPLDCRELTLFRQFAKEHPDGLGGDSQNFYADAVLVMGEQVGEADGTSAADGRLVLRDRLPLLHLAAYAADLRVRGDAAVRVELHYSDTKAKEVLTLAKQRSPSAVKAYLN
jgi:hypothetical protein